MPVRCVRAYFLIRRRTCASNNFSKLDAQWGERTVSTSGTSANMHAAETCIGNRPQETSVTIAVKTPYPQDLIKDALARRPRTKTPTTTPSTPSTPTMTTPSTTQRRPTSSSSFHLLTPQPRRKPEPTWKTLIMLRKKKRGPRCPSTTGETHSTTQPTQG